MIREQLLQQGWRRHSAISLEGKSKTALLAELPHNLANLIDQDGVTVLVALYDCAVVHESFVEEPWVQLLIATPVIEYKKSYSRGRNARCLHFYIQKNGQNLSYEVNAGGICQVARDTLQRLTVDSNYEIDKEEKFHLKVWLAERYRQDTRPDAFNRAIKTCEKRLKKFYHRYNDYVSGIYVCLDTLEELQSQKYSIAVVVAIEPGKSRALWKFIRDSLEDGQEQSLDELKKVCLNQLKNAFGEVVDFQVDPSNKILGLAIEALEENQFTLEHQRKFSRLSPYSLSEFGGGAPFPPEIL